MESVGGEVNAFTTKEETWITSSRRATHTERAIELMADIAFESVFPQHELDKERDVILDEIAGVEDQPADVIFEEFESLLFEGHPLGMKILGDAKHVQGLTRSQVLEFVASHYRPSNMVLGVVGAGNGRKGWAQNTWGEFNEEPGLRGSRGGRPGRHSGTAQRDSSNAPRWWLSGSWRQRCRSLGQDGVGEFVGRAGHELSFELNIRERHAWRAH